VSSLCYHAPREEALEEECEKRMLCCLEKYFCCENIIMVISICSVHRYHYSALITLLFSRWKKNIQKKAMYRKMINRDFPGWKGFFNGYYFIPTMLVTTTCSKGIVKSNVSKINGWLLHGCLNCRRIKWYLLPGPPSF